jgi:hypothetical protein
VQLPLQPANDQPLAGDAVRVAGLPARLALHSPGQVTSVIPPDSTEPDPTIEIPVVGRGLAGMDRAWGVSSKFTVTTWSDPRVTVQEPVPLHPPPDHAASVLVAPGVAVSATDVP